MTVRRWILRVLILLALGASANLIAAAAIWWQLDYYQPMPSTTFPIHEWPLPGYVKKAWPPPTEEWRCIRWASTSQRATSSTLEHAISIDSIGWPMRCLRKVMVFDGTGAARAVVCPEGWLLADHWSKWSDHIPTRVLPLAFVANTLFYSACGGVPWLTAAAGRRSRRRRGNVCGTCGYDRRGLATNTNCPECGHRTPSWPPISLRSTNLPPPARYPSPCCQPRP